MSSNSGCSAGGQSSVFSRFCSSERSNLYIHICLWIWISRSLGGFKAWSTAFSIKVPRVCEADILPSLEATSMLLLLTCTGPPVFRSSQTAPRGWCTLEKSRWGGWELEPMASLFWKQALRITRLKLRERSNSLFSPSHRCHWVCSWEAPTLRNPEDFEILPTQKSAGQSWACPNWSKGSQSPDWRHRMSPVQMCVLQMLF